MVSKNEGIRVKVDAKSLSVIVSAEIGGSNGFWMNLQGKHMDPCEDNVGKKARGVYQSSTPFCL